MAKKKLKLDDIMSETHTVADLRLLLTGNEVVCLAKLCGTCASMPISLTTSKALPKADRATSCSPPSFWNRRWPPRATATVKATAHEQQAPTPRRSAVFPSSGASRSHCDAYGGRER